MLARGLAARRPDLIEGIVSMGSPVLAPGRHPQGARLGRPAAQPAHPCRVRRDDERRLLRRRVRPAQLGGEPDARSTPSVAFTAIYSKRDGIVDWRACLDPAARARRGAHQPLRHGGRPGRDGPRARGAARPAGQAGQPGGSSCRRGGFAPRRSHVIAATSIAPRSSLAQCPPRPAGTPGPGRPERVEVGELGQRAGHEGVPGADRVDHLDRSRPRAGLALRGERGGARRLRG